jgi:flavodoxin
MRTFLFIMAIVVACCSLQGECKAASVDEAGKVLVVYYSYTGNCRQIVESLTSQVEADVMEIEPAEKGLHYEANNYALGTQLLNAINAAPNDPASYPAIDPVPISDLSVYDNIIIVTPLWWSQMAAIMQTYLFHYGPQMAGKHVGLIVSSHSSGISQVVADAKRLVPAAVWMGDALWIRASNHSNRATLIQNWIASLDFAAGQSTVGKLYITIGGETQTASLIDNAATRELVTRLQDGPIMLTLNSSGGFEIWGPLGFALPTSNEQVNAQPGDIVLYNGNNICLFYASNTWSYTRLGHIDDLTQSQLRSFLKAGESNISVTLSLSAGTAGLKGDINGDGEVGIGDVTALVDVLLGGKGDFTVADVNGDGEISIGDVTSLVDILLNSDAR